MTKFAQFIRDEDGAVTIDWVALTAGILLLGIAVVYTIFEGGVSSVVGQINDQLSNASIITGLNTSFESDVLGE